MLEVLDRYKECDKWVLVGSSALYLRGLLNRQPKDIDIVTTDLNIFRSIGLSEYTTLSPYSSTGLRAHGREPEKQIILDIFVSLEKIPYEEVDGFRIATIENELNYYTNLLPVAKKDFKERITKYIQIYERNY